MLIEIEDHPSPSARISPRNQRLEQVMALLKPGQTALMPADDWLNKDGKITGRVSVTMQRICDRRGWGRLYRYATAPDGRLQIRRAA